MTIKMATEILYAKIGECIKHIEGRTKEVKHYYIGMNPLNSQQCHGSVSDEGLKLVKLPEGCVKRLKEYYSRDGLIALAIVTSDSIPEECKEKWYIINLGEYTQILERRIIDVLAETGDERLILRHAEPVDTTCEAYLIYMTYATQGSHAHALCNNPLPRTGPTCTVEPQLHIVLWDRRAIVHL